MPEPAAGTLIDGKYRVLSKLKEGGMGAIYKVHHDLLDEIRVVKVMRSNAARNEDLRRRFLREARLFTRLSHPNIAAIYDFSVAEDGSAMIVMEFIEGRDLEELLHARGALPIDEALEIARQCLLALDYLHGEQILHRDISPENIMVAQEKRGVRVKLIDLGIAKALNDAGETRAGTFLGKVRYSSPEQLSPGDYILDGRTDLYSLGIVLYMLVTGVFPIRGESSSQIMVSHFNEPPIPFSESDPRGRVPEDVRQAILKAIEKEPDARYQSAAEFLQVVERLQQRHNVDLLATKSLRRSRSPLAAVPPMEPRPAAKVSSFPTAVPAAPSTPDRDEGDETKSLRQRPAPRSRMPIAAIAVAAVVILLVLAALATILVRRALSDEPTTETTGIEQPSPAAQRVSTPAPTVPTPNVSGINVVASARAKAESSRARADALDALHRAARIYGQAIERQNDAEALLSTNPDLARIAFLESAELFDGARDAAQAAIVLEEEKRKLREAETKEREPSSSERRAADEYRVRETLGRYIAAQRDLDVDAFMRAYPAASRERVAGAFAATKSLTVTIRPRSIEVAGSRADVVAEETRITVPQRGSIQRTESERTYILEKRGEEWVITSIR